MSSSDSKNPSDSITVTTERVHEHWQFQVRVDLPNDEAESRELERLHEYISSLSVTLQTAVIEKQDGRYMRFLVEQPFEGRIVLEDALTFKREGIQIDIAESPREKTSSPDEPVSGRSPHRAR